jgi:hypothetical protein
MWSLRSSSHKDSAMKRLLLILAISLGLVAPAWATGDSSILCGQATTMPTTGTGYIHVTGQNVFRTDPTFRDARISAPGTLRNFKVNAVTGPTGAGITWTFSVNVNGSPSGITCALVDAATTTSDLTHTVHVAKGDLVSYKVVVSGGTATTSIVNVAAEFFSDNAKESNLLGGDGSGSLSTSATEYLPVHGENVTSVTTEVYNQMVMPCAGTLSKLEVDLDTAPGAGTTRTFNVRKNGDATGCPTSNIADTATRGEDNTTSVAVSAGDLISIASIIAAGTPAASHVKTGLTFTATTAGDFVIPSINSNVTSNASITQYATVTGSMLGFYSAAQLCPVPVAFYAKSIYASLQNAPGASTSYKYGFYVTAGESAATVTVSGTNKTGSTTGQAVSVATTDTICIDLVPTNTPASNCRALISVCGNVNNPAAPPANTSRMFLLF